ncbi:unnamed protein product [Dovyalis caffra]|uniref:Uncharacterized protein n=1 Tax=Dovyalis caffra TaxID=77055 RepID=A0AAV1RI50_9ROSI|nr:unnamed protein product [Dovyalis caffra]
MSILPSQFNPNYHLYPPSNPSPPTCHDLATSSSYPLPKSGSHVAQSETQLQDHTPQKRTRGPSISPSWHFASESKERKPIWVLLGSDKTMKKAKRKLAYTLIDEDDDEEEVVVKDKRTQNVSVDDEDEDGRVYLSVVNFLEGFSIFEERTLFGSLLAK